MYQYKVNVGPYVVRRATFNQVGGLNANFSCPGQPGPGFDFEYAVRLWRHGHAVGLAELGFNHRYRSKETKAKVEALKVEASKATARWGGMWGSGS